MAVSTSDSGHIVRTPVDSEQHDRAFDLNGFLDALAHGYRRYLLYYLKANGVATGEELVEVVTVVATGPDQAVADKRECIVRSLREEHIPQLLDAGLVTCDSEGGTVSLAFLPAFVYDWLDEARREDRNR